MGADKNTLRFHNFPHAQVRHKKQDLVNNQALTKTTLIFTLFRKTQKREWFQTKFGAKRSDFSISRVFLTHWHKYCKSLWDNEFYKTIARMIFSARLKGGTKKLAAGKFYLHLPFWTAFWGRNFRILLWNKFLNITSFSVRKTQNYGKSKRKTAVVFYEFFVKNALILLKFKRRLSPIIFYIACGALKYKSELLVLFSLMKYIERYRCWCNFATKWFFWTFWEFSKINNEDRSAKKNFPEHSTVLIAFYYYKRSAASNHLSTLVIPNDNNLSWITIYGSCFYSWMILITK